MTFDEMLTQIIDLLKRQGRVSYGALKRRFDLDDDYLNDLKNEILYVHPVIDDEGRGLIWAGDTASGQASAPSTCSDNTIACCPGTAILSGCTSLSCTTCSSRRGTTAAHGDVLRPGGLHSPLRPARPRRPTRGGAGVPSGLCGGHPALCGVYCPVSRRWVAGLFWLSP